MTRNRFGALAVLALALVAAPPAGAQATGAKAPTSETKGAPLDERLKALEAAQAEATTAIEALRADLAVKSGEAASREARERLAALERQQAELARQVEDLKKALAAAEKKSPGPIEAPGLKPLSFPLLGSSGSVTSGTAFNPSIAVIPDFVYYRDSEKGGVSEIVEEADGFHGAHAEGGHAHGGLSEGFNLRETEIAFSASVDPYFDAFALFAAGEDGFAAEEVYFQTRRLPAGLQLKGGKFLSGFGYANKQHPHQWAFVDQSLAYDLVLGGGLNEKGLQLTWLPKLPFYLQVGAELLQGENEKIASYLGPENVGPAPVAEGEEPGPDRVLSNKAGPRLFTGFFKVSPDLGYDDALQLGASFAHSTMHQELHDEDGDGLVDEALEGTVDVWGADLVFKHDSPRPRGAGDLVLQAEYLFRDRRLDVVGAPETTRFRQDGLNAQAVYGIAPRWRLAARYDVAGLTNSVREGAVEESFGKSKRWSAALTFMPSEFSLIRAQYSRGDGFVSGEPRKYDQLFLQVQVSLGAHGAHKF